jgi:hypothetical protein
MAKYDPLHRFLADSGQDELVLRFEDIAAMVTGGLPQSARPSGRMARGRLRGCFRWGRLFPARGHVRPVTTSNLR